MITRLNEQISWENAYRSGSDSLCHSLEGGWITPRNRRGRRSRYLRHVGPEPGALSWAFGPWYGADLRCCFFQGLSRAFWLTRLELARDSPCDPGTPRALPSGAVWGGPAWPPPHGCGAASHVPGAPLPARGGPRVAWRGEVSTSGAPRPVRCGGWRCVSGMQVGYAAHVPGIRCDRGEVEPQQARHRRRRRLGDGGADLLAQVQPGNGNSCPSDPHDPMIRVSTIKG